MVLQLRKTIFSLFLLGITVPFFAQDFSFDRFFDENPELSKIATNPNHQVQILYTQIDRDNKNQPTFTTYEFQVDSTFYFYPASTVKMPTAFLALQRLNELGLDKNLPLKIGANRFPQTAVAVDSSAYLNRPAIAHYIKKIFLVSDNDAYNRLYEFLGQDYINTELKKRGFHDTRIKHRLVGGYDGDENQFVNPFWFYNDGFDIVYERPGMKSAYPFPNMEKKDLIRGKGYYHDAMELVIYKPFDFSEKNFISLRDLHDMLQRVMFPAAFQTCERFNLTQEDYQFLRQWMSTLPKDSASPTYDHEDNYVKFILYGDEGAAFEIPEHIKIYNKVGFAYGFVTDVAYVQDEKTGLEFMLAVQILTNENDIFNDGKYEYSNVALPFMGKLGKAIYAHEENRRR